MARQRIRVKAAGLDARASSRAARGDAGIQALLRVIAYHEFPLIFRRMRERIVTEAIEAFYSGR